MPINSIDDLLNALQAGSTIRQTDATTINAKSSRSHAVFSLNLVQNKSSTQSTPRRDKRFSVPVEAMSTSTNEANVTLDSKLHFVDLAGSERMKNTGAQGDRAKEGISINAGLASLGKVISQLSARSHGGHVSYRDSRLTRLLQDSLGGTAITYMVACVTPAEFHLSETMNTLTYAQRARAIQSKPEIQQTHDEKDSTAKLERLQAEVRFLRDQIKHDRDEAPVKNGDRLSVRREKELQDQLMDMQESYNALSQRHAKLIAEISRARDNPDEEMPTTREVIGDSAMERLKRSNSLNQAVEQVVMEYEKTIQSLELSLSNTRSTLSNSESSLMERESKVAYMENVAQQLQARLQKASDRENNNDAYLRDLETQVEGATSSEEQSATLVSSLRKELSRTKENESSAEEYISTLEERLAEAEQDQEIMQREIDRLEHVIERQRSIGRLDNLLADLDGIRQTDVHAKSVQTQQTNGHSEHDVIPDAGDIVEDENGRSGASSGDELAKPTPEGEVIPETPHLTLSKPGQESRGQPLFKEEQQAAQSRFVADKLETTMQELFDLRGEHETAINERDDLQRKYEIALETLAKLQQEQQMSSAESSRPQSFLGHAGVSLNAMAGGQEPTSSSRSLESDSSLSPHATSPTLAEELNIMDGMPTTVDFGEHDDQEDPNSEEHTSEDETATLGAFPAPVTELTKLRAQNAQHEQRIQQLVSDQEELQTKHESALAQVELFKSDLARWNNTLRPSSTAMRRRLSQDVMGTMTNDRTSKSFASVRHMVSDKFEGNADGQQHFENHLNTIMTELTDRSHKIETLDAELQSCRKEMENNQKIIAGLTRERSSLRASTSVDLTVVGQMKGLLEQSEQQLRGLQEVHGDKEKEWQDKFKDLTAQLEQHRAAAEEQSIDVRPEHAAQISRLESELCSWEAKHNDAVASMKTSESELLATIAALEASRTAAENGARELDERHVQSLSNFEQERVKHQEHVAWLQKQIDEHQTSSVARAEELARLELAHADALQRADTDMQSRDALDRELQAHRDKVSTLESQLDSHKATISAHEAGLESVVGNLKTMHAAEIEKLKAEIVAVKESKDHAAREMHDDSTKELQEQHSRIIAELQQDLHRKQVDLDEILLDAATILGHETDVGRFHGHLTDALFSKDDSSTNDLRSQYAQALSRNDEIQLELAAVTAKCTDLEKKVAELKAMNSDTLKRLDEVTEREQKSSRMVQELEEQNSNNFDQHQQASQRLSAMQGVQGALDVTLHAKSELEKELEDARLKISLLESQVTDMARRSVHSSSRESIKRDSSPAWRDSLSPEAAAIALSRPTGAASAGNSGNNRPRSNHNSSGAAILLSPPPAIPLPPLPGVPPLGSTSPASVNTQFEGRAGSPTSSPHTSVGGFSNASTFRAASPNPSVTPDASHALLQSKLDEQDTRLRTLEKHLFAEKQLTATLEEALIDLETSTNKHRGEADAQKRRVKELEDEVVGLRREKNASRASLQQVEEEREMRVRAERARTALEERMRELNGGGAKDGKGKKKKGGALNCF